MNDNNKSVDTLNKNTLQAPNDIGSELNSMDALNQYFKSAASIREGRAIPPLEKWHPEQVDDMDLTIKANGEWWHEGVHMTRQSLVSLFATILWKEENEGMVEYFLKTPVQKLRIQVEDAPLLINDVGIVNEDNKRWLEFTTTTGDVVRLDDEHPISLHAYMPEDSADNIDNNRINHMSKSEETKRSASDMQIRPYMLVRNGLSALIGRNAFYHLTEIGELTERDGETILTLQSGGQSYALSMPSN
ncbi:DUF1285 domain-containing protein [Psychrobacter sp. ANT_WB68]|uniref:DUF1285 domain-containing protein n=1 Tax=Psychrobacter sp. ANT_WB68 TaxID=2597355 RepID=UPI0011F18EA6|nr:DUF1285 domain-containing protein [Psychrobacter sp. ANT_WB68]KAA0912538.1 DUF1285 domain-containing protein [Psychrobacter sp. ANT_WB68]